MRRPERTVCLRIHGLVQGVGFRYSLCREADTLGLNGWVRNRRDGSVEALASGPATAVALLIEWAHRGPPSAQVMRVEVLDSNADDLPSGGFEQRPSV
ncbi:MAG: acylphosphatase [Betaproteobacteria bacterium]|nr:acylphosphatase [Betaproteobacteria bacterium]